MRIRSLFKRIVLVTLLLNISIASAEQLPFYKTKQVIKSGMSGAAVYSLQNYLADMGIFPRAFVTGYFGPITQMAVKVFQLKNGIEPAGVVGVKTKEKISLLYSLKKIVATSTVVNLSLPAVIIATSSPVGVVVTITATSTESLNYSLAPRPSYDLKKLAKDIQNLVNVKRAEFGLSPLYWDEELASVAEEHSKDQAGDNVETTKSGIVCSYPIIRHEGLTSLGYSLKDRYESRNIRYIYGGENIAMIPVSKDLLYLQPVDQEITKCRDVQKFLPGDGTKEDRLALFKSVLEQSKDAVRGLTSVNWVNRAWHSDKELSETAVNGWMNSPGHRENILKKEYTLGGVGIVSINDHLIITHNFASR